MVINNIKKSVLCSDLNSSERQAVDEERTSLRAATGVIKTQEQEPGRGAGASGGQGGTAGNTALFRKW